MTDEKGKRSRTGGCQCGGVRYEVVFVCHCRECRRQSSSAFGIQYAEIMASAVLGALPLIVVFLLFQRQIVEGIATTGIK